MTTKRSLRSMPLLAVAMMLAGAVLALIGRQALGQGTTPTVLSPVLTEVTRPPSSYNDARVLATNAAETVTVPTFAGTDNLVNVIYSATCSDFYVKDTGTAAAPAGDVTDGSASERNPASLAFPQGDTFSLVAPTTCTVTMAMYLGRW